jgi:hypothetical protein
MEIARPIKIPVITDMVLSPDIFYSDGAGIYFKTENNKFGRITFENLDSIKICRGEYMPYEFNSELEEFGIWVFQIENSKWLTERFNYENTNYGDCYEFDGNVNDMLSYYKHYLFSFHDEFVEIIASGFWFEEDDNDLFKKELKEGHPFLPLPENGMERIEHCSLSVQIRINQKSKDKMINDAQFCSQKIFEFLLELDGRTTVVSTVLLSYKNDKLTSALRGYFKGPIAEFDGVANLEQIKPYIKKYMEEVYERREKKRNNTNTGL